MARRRDGMRRGSRRSFSGLLITIALHGVIFMAVKAAHNQPQEPVDRAARFRPGRDGQAGQEARQVLAPEDTPAAAPAATRRDQAGGRSEREAGAGRGARSSKTRRRRKRSKNALARAAKLGALAVPEEPDEGALNGSKTGTSTQAIGRSVHRDRSRALLPQNYNLPAGMNAEQIPSPPEIRFRIGSDGTLSAIKLTKTSGNPLVDDACVSAAQLTARCRRRPPGRRSPGSSSPARSKRIRGI